MANEQNLKPFKKGDSRINRKGRPRTFDQLRSLAQKIAHEVDPDAKEENITVVENMLRKWATGKNPQLQQAFVAYAYGKVPDKQEITGKDGRDLTITVTFNEKPESLTE